MSSFFIELKWNVIVGPCALLDRSLEIFALPVILRNYESILNARITDINRSNLKLSTENSII